MTNRMNVTLLRPLEGTTTALHLPYVENFCKSPFLHTCRGYPKVYFYDYYYHEWEQQQEEKFWRAKQTERDADFMTSKESREMDMAKAKHRELAYREHLKARDVRKMAERRWQGRSGHANPRGGRHKTSGHAGDDQSKVKAGRMLITMAFSVGNLE